jgi:hypothetical protein
MRARAVNVLGVRPLLIPEISCRWGTNRPTGTLHGQPAGEYA